MWKTIYPVSYLSTRWPFIWLGVHFQRDLYLMFRQHQRTESLLKILSNQRSQAGERVESSEWRFRSCKTPKTVEGSILSTQLYYLPLVFFIFKWVRRKYLKTCSMYFVCTRCCICSSTWCKYLMINKYPELSGSIKNESHKAVERHASDGESLKKMLVAMQAECQPFYCMWMWIYRICCGSFSLTNTEDQIW